MSYTHESASKDEFWAAVEGARAVHGTHWTLGDGHPPAWSVEVDKWGTPCILVDRANTASTSYEPNYKNYDPWEKRPAAEGDSGLCFKCDTRYAGGNALCKACTVVRASAPPPKPPAAAAAPRAARAPKVLDARGTASVASFFK